MINDDEYISVLFKKYATDSNYEYIIMSKYINTIYEIANEYRDLNVDLEELCAIGNMVLIISIRIYDEKQHGNFTKFVTNLIRSNMLSYVQEYNNKDYSFDSMIQNILQHINPKGNGNQDSLSKSLIMKNNYHG